MPFSEAGIENAIIATLSNLPGQRADDPDAQYAGLRAHLQGDGPLRVPWLDRAGVLLGTRFGDNLRQPVRDYPLPRLLSLADEGN